jgi:PadR family transcriptional regulator PadR
MSPRDKHEIRQGTLALMVLRTRTLYPILLKLEQEGAIASEWGLSENNRRARFYRLTKAGRTQLSVEKQQWQETAAIISSFLLLRGERR